MGDAARRRRLAFAPRTAEQTRIAAARKAALEVKRLAHAQLEAHLNEIMPELLTDISIGMGFTVGIRTLPPPTAEDLDPNAEAILSQRTGVLDEHGEEVRRLGLEK